ncbi:hypothetical protein L1987_37791 [Smallanthus sonchifolius]|uniref:Uncharacterized protein n=1 Tax=Smallanthus sonchifolius TaxID=185202 RepID=A0ACB9HGW7_9ASTR|nr:hypothetical protein L1987_37791 [Smallanthus sonchifolius]
MSIVETSDSSAEGFDYITAGLGFSNKDLINSDISQTADYKATSPVSKYCFDQIVHVAKDFIRIKFMKEEDNSSDEQKIEKVDAIHIHTTKKLPSPWKRDKVAERLKNKRVKETTKATMFKKPCKACFKYGEEGHVAKHYKKVDKTSSSILKRHGSDGKGNKSCFFGSKSTRNNPLNDQKKNYSSTPPYVKSVSHDSKIKTMKDTPRNSHAPNSKFPRPSKVKQTYVPKPFSSKLKE